MDQDRALARRKLARAAARLNVASGMAGRLPPLALMTDDEHLKDPLSAARMLPRGSLVVVRAREAKAQEKLAQAILAIAQVRDLIVLIAGDAALAARCGADGLHLPEARAGEIAHWRARLPHSLITASAHSLGAVARVREADAIFLSPVFPTRSHPGRASLTPMRANAIAQMSPVPAYALGGVTADNAGLLGCPFVGIAAIGALAA